MELSSYSFMLKAASAIGLGFSSRQGKSQERFARIGADLERNELRIQMAQENLAASESSYFRQEQLRDTLASQRAIYAARGQSSGQGSPLFAAQGDIRAANMDEQAKQISMTFRKHQLSSANRLMGINTTARNHKRRSDRFVQGLNTININSILSPYLNKSG